MTDGWSWLRNAFASATRREKSSKAKKPRKARTRAGGRGFTGVRQFFASRWTRYALAAAGVIGIAAFSAAAYSGSVRTPVEPPNPSRCPQNVAARGGREDDAAAKSRVFSLLVDPVGSAARGTDLRLAYDVCGLERGAPFRTRITVTKNQSGLRRMLGRVEPVTMTLDEAAAGPATRRHRTVKFSQMPAGTYSLTVVVTDDNGRKRERALALQVVERTGDR